MSKVEKNYSLKKHNTFCIDVKTKYFVEPKNVEECLKVLKEYKEEKFLILGGGSNILLMKDWQGIVVKPIFKGKKVVDEDDEYITVEIASGEDWDSFVRWCVKNDYAGVENMVMIPGTVGGAIAQNIAAYGQNITDTLQSIQVLDIGNLKKITLLPSECGYAYRESYFKNKWENKYIINSALFKLKKHTDKFELSYHERVGRYGSILEELNSFAKEPFSIQDVMEAIVRQRTKRLPSIEEYGTCGSFFTNPVVTIQKYKDLSEKIDGLQSYPVENLDYKKEKEELEKEKYVKIPAGRLLDELGWRGKWEGNVGSSEKHALCVVTNKKADSQEIYNFILKLQKSVKDNYDVDLIPEVNIIF